MVRVRSFLSMGVYIGYHSDTERTSFSMPSRSMPATEGTMPGRLPRKPAGTLRRRESNRSRQPGRTTAELRPNS